MEIEHWIVKHAIPRFDGGANIKRLDFCTKPEHIDAGYTHGKIQDQISFMHMFRKDLPVVSGCENRMKKTAALFLRYFAPRFIGGKHGHSLIYFRDMISQDGQDCFADASASDHDYPAFEGGCVGFFVLLFHHFL